MYTVSEHRAQLTRKPKMNKANKVQKCEDVDVLARLHADIMDRERARLINVQDEYRLGWITVAECIRKMLKVA